MTRTWFISAVTVCCCLLTAGIHAGYEATGFLYKDGIPQGTINPPVEAGPAMRFAIDELSLHLEKITGRKMIVNYREAAGNDPGITLSVKRSYAGDTGQDFTIFEDGKKITITGNSELAVLYGVYQYLDELGVRWYAPGKLGTDIPALKDIPVKRDKALRKYSPSTLAREIDYSASWRTYDFRFASRQEVIGKYHHEHDLLALRNRQHFARPGHNGHFFSFNNSNWGGSHGITSILQGVDIKEEPERFALVPVNGQLQRSNDFNRVQICFTNEKNVEAAIEYIKKSSGDGKRMPENMCDLRELTKTIIPLGLGDCKGFCRCENCEKAAGSGEYREDRLVWSFMNKVAKRMQTEAPEKRIGIFAPYSMNMKQPPPDVKLEKNIFAQACRTEASLTDTENLKTYPFNKEFFQNLAAIRDAGALQGNYDYFLYKTTPTPLSLLDAAKAYHEKLGFRTYHIEIMQLNAQTYAYCWAIARYLWDDTTDPRKNLEEYCKKFYGDAAGTEILKIMAFYDLKERNLERIELGSMENTHMILPDSLIQEGRKILKNALALAPTQKHRKRVQFFLYTFESQAQAAEIYRAACKMLNSRSGEDLAAFRQAVQNYETFWANPEVKDAVHPDTLSFVRHFVKPFNTEEIRKIKLKPPVIQNQSDYITALFAGDHNSAACKKIQNLFPLPDIWKFRIDYNHAAEKEKWFEPNFDDSRDFQPVSIRDVIENQGYPLIDGHFCCRISFTAPDFPAGKKIFLRFGGIDDRGRIYVNGTLVGETKVSDWDKSCVFEVTQQIRRGQMNQITVLGHDSYGGAGIWRAAALYTD